MHEIGSDSRRDEFPGYIQCIHSTKTYVITSEGVKTIMKFFLKAIRLMSLGYFNLKEHVWSVNSFSIASDCQD